MPPIPENRKYPVAAKRFGHRNPAEVFPSRMIAARDSPEEKEEHAGKEVRERATCHHQASVCTAFEMN
jgi:hypothetical protein